MPSVIDSLFSRQDPLLSLVAAVILLAAALCVFRLRSRMRYSRASARTAWIFLGGAVLGVGVWSSDSIGLAAGRAGQGAGFEPMGALGSLLLAVTACVAAMALAWTRGDRWRTLSGGMMLAFAFAAMRALAFLSLRTPAHVSWEPIVLWFGVAASTVFATAALGVAGAAQGLRRQAAGAALLCLSLWSLDAASGAAAAFVPDPALRLGEGLLAPNVLIFIAVMLAGLMILGGLGAAYIDDVSSRTAIARTRRLADAAREGILVVSDGGVVLDVNAAFATLALAPIAQIVRRPLAELLDLPAGLEPGDVVEASLRLLDGSTIPVEAHVRPLHDRDEADEPTSVVVVRDLREKHAVEARIRYLAEHDPLTGLANRAALTRMVEARLASGMMLAFIRVVNHAETNSLLGHAAGDAVLEKIAERLKRVVDRPVQGYTCMVARLGGAEFALAICGQVQHQDPTARAFPMTLARALGRAVALDGHMIEPQIRIGVAAAPVDCDTTTELFRHAEVALDLAMREESVDGVTFFRQDLQDELVARRTLIQELKVGIAEDQLVVFYQPQARTSDGALCGFEALVRWTHPVRGFMPPDRFIPAAEQSGLIVALGEHVLRRACADAAGWPEPVPVAVNLSPLQVGQVDLPRLVHEVLIETGLPPSRLELEITESALFRDFQRALDTLRRLKSLGVKIAMDDFGTGFSSLSTLQSFPFDKIKIDKSFVSDAGDRGRSTVIVKAVLGIGRGLGIPVVAEGVETAEQMAFLREEQCAAVQGYYIGKPGPISLHAALFEALKAPPARPKPRSRKAA